MAWRSFNVGPAAHQIRNRSYAARVNHGFTLVEVLVSLFLVVVTMVPIFVMMLSARVLDYQARVQGAAYNVAREQLEVLRAKSFAGRLPVSEVGFTIPPTIAAEFPEISLSGAYTVSVIKTTSPAVQQISVEVRWYRRDASAGRSCARVSALVASGAGN